jgi:hypothetical protein
VLRVASEAARLRRRTEPPKELDARFLLQSNHPIARIECYLEGVQAVGFLVNAKEVLNEVYHEVFHMQSTTSTTMPAVATRIRSYVQVFLPFCG